MSAPASAVVGMPATVGAMPLSYEERARKAGKASAAAKSPAERADAGRRAAQGAHGVVATARKLAARWADATPEEQKEARSALRAAGIIR